MGCAASPSTTTRRELLKTASRTDTGTSIPLRRSSDTRPPDRPSMAVSGRSRAAWSASTNSPMRGSCGRSTAVDGGCSAGTCCWRAASAACAFSTGHRSRPGTGVRLVLPDPPRSSGARPPRLRSHQEPAHGPGVVPRPRLLAAGADPNPVIRCGFRLFGRWTQERYYRNVLSRMSRLSQAAQHGLPLPTPTARADGMVLAPSGVRPHPMERLARGWLHAGSQETARRKGEMMATKRARRPGHDILGVYLNDQLAGATLGTELARRMAASVRHRSAPASLTLVPFPCRLCGRDLRPSLSRPWSGRHHSPRAGECLRWRRSELLARRLEIGITKVDIRISRGTANGATPS